MTSLIVTTSSVKRFVGGQIRIDYPTSVFCGQIKTIDVNDNELRVILDWMASGETIRGRYPRRTIGRWVNTVVPSFKTFNLYLPGIEVNYTRPRRVRLENHKAGQYVLLSPPRAPLIDPRTVTGLRLSD